MSSRIPSALGRSALAFALLLAFSAPLAAVAHEPHAHSPGAPEAAQAELAPAAAGCCAMADAAKSDTPKAAGCAAGDHPCCAKCEHCSQPGATSCCAGHGAMGDHAAGHAGHHPGMAAPAAHPGDAKTAHSCGQGGDPATCCAGCDHCKNAEGGGCCAGHAAMAEKAAFACPMHPAVTGAEGGKCAECGMKLEAVAPGGETKKP